MAKPKLFKKHYVEIINRTIAGETRSSIAKDMPVDVRRICRIVCDFADSI